MAIVTASAQYGCNGNLHYDVDQDVLDAVSELACAVGYVVGFCFFLGLLQTFPEKVI